jgi:hypothetical protein
MLRPSLSRAVLVILLLLMAVPSLQAAEPGGPSFSWSFLARTWDFLTSIWGDNGCSVDPNGRCLPGQHSVVALDNGCRVDPDGLCVLDQHAAVALDNGCEMDPSGRCLAGQHAVVPADNGCEVDPDGRCRN